MSTANDLVRRAKWRWRYERKQTARRSRSWVAHMPGARHGARSLWVCSWQRSGSTWLAEMLAAPRGTRLVYEPANLHDSTFDGPSAAASPMPRGEGVASRDVIRALRGEIRGPWVDQLNRTHVVERTIVKDVRALGVAGEVHAALPDTPVVVLVRHPFAVASSVLSLGWTLAESADDAFLREVTSWCEAHERAFADSRLEDCWFVTYEALRSDTNREMKQILQYAATFDSSWSAIDATTLDPERRSSTDFRDERSADKDRTFDPIDSATMARAADLLERHGLGELYGPEPGARCELDTFVANFRERGGRRG